MFNTNTLPMRKGKGKETQRKAGLETSMSGSGCKASNTWRTRVSSSSLQRNGLNSNNTRDTRTPEVEPLRHTTRLSVELVGTEMTGNRETVLINNGEAEQHTDMDAKNKVYGGIKNNVTDVARQWKAQVHEMRALNEVSGPWCSVSCPLCVS